MLNFYSITLSFLIHSLLYAFSDIWCLTIALVGGNSDYILPWAITWGIAPEWLIFYKILTNLNWEQRIAGVLKRAGWNDPTNPNWYEEILEIIEEEKLAWIMMTSKPFKRLMIIRAHGESMDALDEEIRLLYLMKKSGWKDPDDPNWYNEGTKEIYLINKALTMKTELQMIIRGCLPDNWVSVFKKKVE